MTVVTQENKMDLALASGGGEVIGPLTETVQTASDIIWNMVAANLPRDLHWQFILVTLIIAAFIWLIRGGRGSRDAAGRERKADFLQFLFPKDIYTHVSARVDIWLWVTERLLRPFWVVGLLATVGPSTETAVIGVLQWTLGATPAIAVNYGWMLLYSLVTLLCYDFVFFLIHYTMHKVPALWVLHKVHH